MTDKTPAQREADGDETITIEWDGIPVEIPATVDQLDLDVIEAFETGRAVTAIRSMVDDFDALKAQYRKTHGRRPRLADLTGLSDAIAEAYGFGDSGN